MILAGSLGAAAANLVLVAADGPEVGIAARVATGFFLAGVYPPRSSCVDMVPLGAGRRWGSSSAHSRSVRPSPI